MNAEFPSDDAGSGAAAAPIAQTGVDAAAPVGFPIVGIGASAGGLAAFKAFFSGMPPAADPDMAFVLVQHLAPNHVSILADLITRFTRMPVVEATDGVMVKANRVYILPPNHDMALMHGAIQLLPPSQPRGHRLPIDHFFRSLALDQRENAVAIVLSGTGSDGALGVREIKGAGGMVMAQAPQSGDFDGMPRAAIATGLVDYELAPGEMPAQLIAYAARASKVLRSPGAAVTPAMESQLTKVLLLLRAHTGHDFSLYKPSSVLRRIGRRKALQLVESFEDYVKILQQTPAELDALFRDLLIGVTSFFRDPQAFAVLDTQLGARIFAGKPPGANVRIWAVACSTGEEAYSIAMLLREHMEALKQNYSVQIFATDIDPQAIATARAGLYPTSIAVDLTPERLARFFTLEPGGGYRVRKFIRDMITFAEQSVVKDPPFSQLDLISCRNLLIYLRGELQQKLFRLFNYSLLPGGMLFLGSAEGAGEIDKLFAPLDIKARLFRKLEDAQRGVPGTCLPATTEAARADAPRRAKSAPRAKSSLGKQTEQALLQLLAPTAALVAANGDILHLRGRTGLYLEPEPGDAGTNNIVNMARDGLAQDLKIALHEAVHRQRVVRRGGLRVRTNGAFTAVNLTICPMRPELDDLLAPVRYLVVLGQPPATDTETLPVSASALAPGPAADARIAELEHELRAKDRLLRTAHDDAGTSNEELSSALEEMQSVNEELQSSNEELATSQEELQSVNEELATVNVEQQSRVMDLARALNDNRNLLAGSGIATVFVDRRQRVMSFTPTATRIIELVPTDVGRPLGNFVANLRGYDRLSEDIASVLDTLTPIEVKVQDKAGHWYMLRVLPYRTLENVIEGAAITFVDISEIVKAQVDIAQLQKAHAALRESEQRYRSVVTALDEGLVLLGSDDKIKAWNPAAERILGLSAAQLLGMQDFDPAWRSIHEDGSPFPLETWPGWEVLRTGVPRTGAVMGIQRPDSALLWVSINAVPIRDPDDPSKRAVVVTFFDITERKQVEELSREASESRRLAAVVRDSHDAITLHALDGSTLAWNPAAQRLYGWSEAEALQMNLLDRVPPDQHQLALERLLQLGQAPTLEPYRAQRLAKDGSVLNVSITASALRDAAGQVYAVATTERAGIEGVAP